MTQDSTADEAIVLTSSWARLPELVGQRFQGEWFRLPAKTLELFDQATCIDHNTAPMDGDLYPEGLIEGFHLLAMLDHLQNPLIRIEEPDLSGWNYGFDHVRFVSIVTIADRIRLSGEVMSVEPKGNRYLLAMNCTIDVEGREKPGLAAEWKVMWTRTSLEDMA